MNHKTRGTYISVDAKHVLSPSCSVCGCSRKKKNSKLLFWQSDLVRLRMQKTIITLILFCAMKLSCPASDGQRHSVRRRLFSFSPFLNGSALREAIICLRTMVCQMQRKKSVVFLFCFIRNWAYVPFFSGLAACVIKIHNQGHVKHNLRTKALLRNERLALWP